MQSVKLTDIRTDGGTQMRASLNEDTVAEYANIIRDGTDFPAVTLFFDGSTHWLADGFHRFFAYKQAGAEEIPAEVHQGTKREAVLHSVRANAQHGLPRTREDKRKAVLTLLEDAEWAKWSNREIADRAGVTHPFVSKLREEMEAVTGNVSSERTYQTRHGTTATMETENIGKPAGREDRKAAQEEAERQRADNIAQLPESVRQRYDAQAEARARANSGVTVGLAPEDRTAELEAQVESLEADNASLRVQLADHAEKEPFYADWKAGGLDAVKAAMDRNEAYWKEKYHSENREKVATQREIKRLRQGNPSNDMEVMTDVEVVRHANAR